ncbi:MAG: hypothetical protein NTU89_03465 [Candidatus Dependentiae bacterium]|nr:hypothetical protein [Candidatus Dependentiae bacterium]
MKTLFICSFFILACGSTAFASLDQRINAIRAMADSFENALYAKDPINYSLKSNKQELCIEDKINKDTVCFSKEELIEFLVFRAMQAGRPSSADEIKHLQKTIMSDSTASLIATFEPTAKVDFSVETPDKSHSFSFKITEENDHFSYLLKAFGQGTISK